MRQPYSDNYYRTGYGRLSGGSPARPARVGCRVAHGATAPHSQHSKAQRKSQIPHTAHPGRRGGPRLAAENRFKELAAAWAVLGEEETRRAYDDDLQRSGGGE